jgi:hypothetical protein
MFQLHFFLNHIIDFKNFVQQKHVPFYESVHRVDLMKNQIMQKFQSFEIWKERAKNQRIHFLSIWQKQYV